MSSKELEIGEIVIKIKNIIRGYQFTNKCVYGIKYYLIKNCSSLKCNYAGSEVKLKFWDGKEAPRPDFLIESSKKDKGIFGEVKGRLSYKEEFAEEEILKLERLNNKILYSKDSKPFPNFSICLAVYNVDCKRAISLIGELMKNKKFKLTRKLCVLSWAIQQEFRRKGEALVIRKEKGDIDIGSMNNYLNEKDIIVDLEDQELSKNLEKVKFSRIRPHPVYLISFLWTDIFNDFSPENKDFEATIQQLVDKINEFYPPWSDYGENSQVRNEWIVDALKDLEKIGYAKRDESDPYKFKIYYNRTPKGKDLTEAFAELLIQKDPKLKQDAIDMQRKLVK